MSENFLPEEKARKKIDMLLKKAGWSIVPRDQYSPGVSAVAIEEGLLKGNLEADYLLFLEGKAIGVLEAKKESVSLDDIVANQAENYTHKLLPMYQEIKKIKALSVELLAKVKQKISELDHWRDKPVTQAIIDNLIRDTLFDGLPQCYDDQSITNYRNRLYEYIYTRYPDVAV